MSIIPAPFNSTLDISVQLALLTTQNISAVSEALGKIAGYSKTLSEV